MRSMSLHVRLALALLALLLINGALALVSNLVTTRLYMQEVVQGLNLGLARNIAELKHEALIADDGGLQPQGIEQLLHWMMVVNPGVQFYLLDLRGRVLAYDPAAGEPALREVSLMPVRDFLDRGLHEASPDAAPPVRAIVGDDPRDPQVPKVFSVSPIPPRGEPRGYLYVVLDSRPFESVAEELRHSYILRLSARNGLAYLAVALALGFLTFRWLTRPLRRLVAHMETLDPETDGEAEVATGVRPAGGDEVDRLEHTFGAMVQRIRGQVDEIERMSDLRRELIANVSHDLRTPIATLRGYLETLTLKKGVLQTDQREEYLAVALRQSERLGRLVDELFELTKLDRQEVQPAMERFRIAELVQDNVQRFRLPAQERGVRLAADFDPDLPPVYADIGLMERALENLIDNALRHTGAGGKVTVRLREEPQRLRVSVEDTGSGIAADDLPHVFDRYYRARRRGGQGAGLGLAITRHIVELHGGELSVASAPGQGSTFSFDLAVAPRTYQLATVDRPA